jgi:hypothetical protein
MQALAAEFPGLRRKNPLLFEKKSLKQFVPIHLFIAKAVADKLPITTQNQHKESIGQTVQTKGLSLPAPGWIRPCQADRQQSRRTRKQGTATILLDVVRQSKPR